jgi:hypothetical protein
MRVYFDIETIPSQQPGAREAAKAGIKPPANYKKEDTIAAWWADQGEQAAEDAYRKQALDGAEGEVCAASWAIDDGTVFSMVRPHEEDEATFLRKLVDALGLHVDRVENEFYSPQFPEPIYLIGHNAMFDIGFMRRRCWVHGIKPPTWFPALHARDGKDYGDTMTMWAGYRERISLDRLCKALGVPSPKVDGMHGGAVFELWQAGEFDKIATYNAADVMATRQCWLRMAYELDDQVEDAA